MSEVKKKTRRPKKSSSGPKAPSKQTKGLKPASVHRVMVEGSGIAGCRIAKKAVASTIDFVESLLKLLGQKSLEMLELTKKKTVKKAVLLAAVRSDSRLSCQKGVRAAIQHADEGDENRKTMARAASVRCFAKGIAHGRGAYKISEEAKNAIADVAMILVKDVARAAARYVTITRSQKKGAASKGHNTIKSKHVKMAKEQFENFGV